MKSITITADELKAKIEKHLISKGLQVELNMIITAQSGGQVQNVRLDGLFNSSRTLEFEIYFNGHYEAIITGFKGSCPISDLTQILTELQIVLNNL